MYKVATLVTKPQEIDMETYLNTSGTRLEVQQTGKSFRATIIYTDGERKVRRVRCYDGVLRLISKRSFEKC